MEMKKLSKKSFEEIRLWVYRNARQFELALWQYEFENGSKEAVLSALAYYQNDDGGFGNALEPDSWNPESTPYTTKVVIDLLRSIDFVDAKHPIIQGMLKFFESGKHREEYGWLWSIPSNENHAHAPWWNYDPKMNENYYIDITPKIVCFLLQFAEKDSALYQQAIAFTNRLLADLKKPENKQKALHGRYALSEMIKQLGLTDQFEISHLTDNLKAHIDETICRDVSQWTDYNVKPSEFIPSPNSPFLLGNEATVHTELDYLIEIRPENNVWGITWKWWDNYDKYPKEFAISEHWWKSWIAIEKLKFLRAFDRLDV